MNSVLVYGSGMREHALSYSLALSPDVDKVFWASEHVAEMGEPKIKRIRIAQDDFSGLERLVRERSIGLVVVGPEAPLEKGIADYFHAAGYHRIFAPARAAARLESDKFFSYDIMKSCGIPQAEAVKCHSLSDIRSALHAIPHEGVVLKARGLSQGKGVLVCSTRQEALENYREHAKRFGPEMLVAKRLYGKEMSVFGISDGKTVVPIPVIARDSKMSGEGDTGQMTGGILSYGPVTPDDAGLALKVCNEYMQPVVTRMHELGHDYIGCIYFGLMECVDGLHAIEINTRFGDPEENVLAMLLHDIYPALEKAVTGRLSGAAVKTRPGFAASVVLCAPGYPGEHMSGYAIGGLETVARMKNLKVFYGGVEQRGSSLFASGGRLLGVTAYHHRSLAECADSAYSAVEHIFRETERINMMGRVPFEYREDLGGRLWR